MAELINMHEPQEKYKWGRLQQLERYCSQFRSGSRWVQTSP